MKKIITETFLIILVSVSAISAQVLKPSVTISRDKASIIQRLPGKIQNFVPQIRLPQSDPANKNTAQNGHTLSSSFTLSPDAMKVDGKGQIDFIGAQLIAASGSPVSPYPNVPMALIEGNQNGGSYSSSVLLTISSSEPNANFLVDCNVFAPQLTVTSNAGAPPQTLVPNSNGHAYFVLSSPNGGATAIIENSGSMWAFFSCDISKLN